MRWISKFLCLVLLLVGLCLDCPIALTSARTFRRTPTEIRDRLHFDLSEARAVAAKYQAAILVFALGSPHSYLRVVTPTEFSDFTLPSGSEIDTDVEKYIRMIAMPPRGGSGEDYRPLSAKLYDALLRPAAPLLKGKRLLVVPDSSLSALPFETLISDPHHGAGARFLGEEFAVSYASSVPQFLSLARRPQSSNSLTQRILVYADPVYRDAVPRLISSRYEALNIQRMFPHQTSLLMRQAATKESINDRSLGRYGILHFATHGFFSSETPSKSGILLSGEDRSGENGLLTAEDVAGLELNASSLVVLSACNTALGTTKDGLSGLADAFLRAGAREVVSSLWSINDFSSADFMEKFYSRMQEGQSPTDALRNAKQAMMRTRIPYAHPHYWAPFVHTGAF
jgi:CHAT domain-containing protein